MEKEKCFFSGEEKRRRKRMKIFGEEKTFFRRRKRGKCHYSGTNERTNKERWGYSAN